jgi:hypothetical protein
MCPRVQVLRKAEAWPPHSVVLRMHARRRYTWQTHRLRGAVHEVHADLRRVAAAFGEQAEEQGKMGDPPSVSSAVEDLWTSHPGLIEAFEDRHFPKHGGAMIMQTHHLYPGPITGLVPPDQRIGEQFDLCESIDKHGAWFRPLVRESFALHCGLIDGRIKTLVDALTMPSTSNRSLSPLPGPRDQVQQIRFSACWKRIQWSQDWR